MARKTQKHREAGEIFVSDPLELNRWCVEMAVRWPVHHQQGYSQMGGSFQQPVHNDEDVIGRAGKIMAWVKAKH